MKFAQQTRLFATLFLLLLALALNGCGSKDMSASMTPGGYPGSPGAIPLASMELAGHYTYIAPADGHAELKGLTLLAMNDAVAAEFPPVLLADGSAPKFSPQANKSETNREEMLDLDADYVNDDFGDYKGDAEPAHPTPSVPDPFEGFNRAMFQFNDFLYFNLLKPAAIGYKALVPQPARIGVRNVFYNVRFPVRFANDLLQGKFVNAGREILRFLVDTIFGFGGLVRCSRDHDLLNPPPQDLGRTFATWGIGSGPYFVWPLFGSKTLRQTVGDMGDTFADPIFWLTPPWYPPYLIRAGEVINDTSLQIGEYEALKEAAIDPYTAIKDIYMQYRNRPDNDRMDGDSGAPQATPTGGN